MHRGDIVEKCGYCWTRLSNWRDESFAQCFLMHFSLSLSEYGIYVGYYGNRGCRACNRGPIPRHYYRWVLQLRHSCCLLPTMTLTPRLVDIPPIVPPNDEPPPTALDKAPHDGDEQCNDLLTKITNFHTITHHHTPPIFSTFSIPQYIHTQPAFLSHSIIEVVLKVHLHQFVTSIISIISDLFTIGSRRHNFHPLLPSTLHFVSLKTIQY